MGFLFVFAYRIFVRKFDFLYCFNNISFKGSLLRKVKGGFFIYREDYCF